MITITYIDDIIVVNCIDDAIAYIESTYKRMIWIPDKIHGWSLVNILYYHSNLDQVEVEINRDNKSRSSSSNGGGADDNGSMTIVTMNQTVNLSDTHVFDSSHVLDLDDLCMMNNMHEAPLLDLLKRRFRKNKIYTLSGSVLISLNPYQLIPGLYDSPEDHISLNLHTKLSLKISKNSPTPPPHVYGIANTALSTLMKATSSSSTSSTRGVGGVDGSSDVAVEGQAQALINQSIIISGESGAGKTENSKHVMNFLIAANQYIKKKTVVIKKAVVKPSSLSSSVDDHPSIVQEQEEEDEEESFIEKLKSILLQSSVILESFGNAKTVRNDNSSRFGKYIKLMYSSHSSKHRPGISHPILSSAFTETFLLEKSRLVNVGEKERNYHVFYQLLRGLPLVDPSLSHDLRLDLPMDSYRLLVTGHHCSVISSEQLDTDDSFLSTIRALEALQFTTEEQQMMWRILACILHLGNIDCIESGSGASNVQMIPPTIDMSLLAEFMGLMDSQLMMSLTTQRLEVRGRMSIKIKMLSRQEVQNNIHALIKWIYNRLFLWIVRKINYTHASCQKRSSIDDSDSGASISAIAEKDGCSIIRSNSYIGILDIFGFEILELNSLEQLCINYTNERLQQQFNEFIFVNEQNIYRQGGLNWSDISFRDNQTVIDLIGSAKTGSKQGLLLLLEEQCMLNRAPDDAALINAFNKAHEPTTKISSRSISTYSRSKFGKNGFVIQHFAGSVSYLVDGFIVKNNDSLQEDLTQLLQLSTCSFFRNALSIGTPDPEGPGHIPSSSSGLSEPSPTSDIASASGSSKGKHLASSNTVSKQFRIQLDELMTTLRKTVPHYIKCIKPNDMKQPHTIEPMLVLEQLRYSGFLEAVRIRREGFPIRSTFIDFIEYNVFTKRKCQELYPELDGYGDNSQQQEVVRDCCSRLAAAILPVNQFQIGHSMIFLRPEALQLLDSEEYDFFERHCTLLQSRIRTFLQRKIFKKLIVEKRVRDAEVEMERIRAEKMRVEKEAEKNRLEKLYQLKVEEEKEAERAEKAEKARLEKIRIEIEAENARLEKLKLEQAAETARLEKLRIEEENAERVRLEKIKSEEETARKMQAEKLKIQQEAENARLEKLRLEEEAAERARLEKVQLEEAIIQQANLEQLKLKRQEAATRTIQVFLKKYSRRVAFHREIDTLFYILIGTAALINR